MNGWLRLWVLVSVVWAVLVAIAALLYVVLVGPLEPIVWFFWVVLVSVGMGFLASRDRKRSLIHKAALNYVQPRQGHTEEERAAHIASIKSEIRPSKLSCSSSADRGGLVAVALGFFLLQWATYILSIVRWFTRDHAAFWHGFKELIWALIPIVNFTYVWDLWFNAFGFVVAIAMVLFE